MKFKPGDKVICIDNIGSNIYGPNNSLIYREKVYTITKISFDNFVYLRDTNIGTGYAAERFRLSDNSLFKKKLSKLLKT